MRAKTISLCVTALVVVYIVAAQFADNQNPEVISLAVGAGLPKPYADFSATPARDCPTNTSINPFGHTAGDCGNWGDTPIVSATEKANAGDASTIGGTLRVLEQCNKPYRKGEAALVRCNDFVSAEASLVDRLEYLTKQGSSQARFELGMQLQRREERTGRQPLNAADVAEDTQLQRAVALLAEAVAAGNPDAQRFKDALGDRARLLHTGR